MSLLLVDPSILDTKIAQHLGRDTALLISQVLDLCGFREIESTEPEWCAFYGGEDPDSAAGVHHHGMQEADAREDAQWLRESGVAKRLIAHGPWIVQPLEGTEP